MREILLTAGILIIKLYVWVFCYPLSLFGLFIPEDIITPKPSDVASH